MKRGFLALKGTKLPFILIAFLCTTLLIWGWDKAPFLVALLPQNQLVKLPPDNVIDTKPQRHVDNNLGNSTRNETFDKNDKKVFDLEAQNDSAKESEQSTNEEDVKTVKGKDEDALEQLASANTSSMGAGKEKQDVKTVMGKDEDALEQMASANTSSLRGGKDEQSFTYQANKQSCNYAKGKWVMDDDRRTLYSGGRCRQWLSEMWACRLTDRTDFAYEKLRWQPKDCNMNKFSGSKFLRRMRNKTLAFVGDSLGRQQFQSLMCMITGGRDRSDVGDVGREYGLVKARGAVRPDGWAYRFRKTNTTILFYWSACLCDLQKLGKSKRKSAEIAMHLDRPPAFLSRYLDKFDVLVLNTGHHWNRGKFDSNHWVMHIGGVPSLEKNVLEAKNLTIHSIIKWVDSQLPSHPKLRAFYRSISPRHFFNGDWNTGGTCDNTNPMSTGKEVITEESSDSIAAMTVKGTNLTFLDITGLSELRDEGHISKYTIRPNTGTQDCLHWCLPGIPDTWNEILFAQLFPF